MGEKSGPATSRMAQFFSMVMAHVELMEEDFEDSVVIVPFMGSGASDNLTVGCIKAFLEEQRQ